MRLQGYERFLVPPAQKVSIKGIVFMYCRIHLLYYVAHNVMISCLDFQHPKWKTFIIADESPTNGLYTLERKGFLASLL